MKTHPGSLRPKIAEVLVWYKPMKSLSEFQCPYFNPSWTLCQGDTENFSTFFLRKHKKTKKLSDFQKAIPFFLSKFAFFT